jgi:hypothetical protein
MADVMDDMMELPDGPIASLVPLLLVVGFYEGSRGKVDDVVEVVESSSLFFLRGFGS